MHHGGALHTVKAEIFSLISCSLVNLLTSYLHSSSLPIHYCEKASHTGVKDDPPVHAVLGYSQSEKLTILDFGSQGPSILRSMVVKRSHPFSLVLEVLSSEHIMQQNAGSIAGRCKQKCY